MLGSRIEPYCFVFGLNDHGHPVVDVAHQLVRFCGWRITPAKPNSSPSLTRISIGCSFLALPPLVETIRRHQAVGERSIFSASRRPI